MLPAAQRQHFAIARADRHFALRSRTVRIRKTSMPVALFASACVNSEFVSSGVKMFFLGKLDAALDMISAAAFGRFRSVDLNSRTTKNRYDGDSE